MTFSFNFEVQRFRRSGAENSISPASNELLELTGKLAP